MRRLAVICVAAVVVPAALAKPPGPPPQGVKDGPPPGWIETVRESRWLAYGSSCWRTLCVDYIAPELRKDIPVVKVRLGELVQLHLGFQPKGISLTLGGRPYTPAAGRVIQLRVKRGGLLVLGASSRSTGDAAYLARLKLI